ncbi:hypothetical protein J6590_015488 [Homalodisca vitripennis]|nr:hypothetical protein J6590_094783 [Homalodisca vitripennis]KAG8337818.1 hypothetical protein J6590_015488 [Homalodisca vitripennis]
MSLVLIIVSITLASVFCQIEFQSPNSGQTYGSPGWLYSTPEGEDTASKLTSLVTDTKNTWENYVTAMKTSNNASKALVLYEEAGDSVEGTACAPSDDDQYRSSVIEKISNTVESCAAFSNFTCGGHFCTLIELTTEALVVVQKADYELELLRELCFSLRVTQPPSCVEDENKLLETINNTVSVSQLSKYYYEISESLFPSMANLVSCVDHGVFQIQAELEFRTQSLIDCRNSL